MKPRLFALIPCAGIGSRAGSALPKQYRAVAGKNLLYHALSAFDACSELAQTLVVLAPEDGHFDPRRFVGLRFAVRRCGGATRHASVLNGLAALGEFGARDLDWILVHDAARPGITPALIRALISAVGEDEIGGILALPVADTLKRGLAGPLAAAAASAGVLSNSNYPVAVAPGLPGTGTTPGAVRIAATEDRSGLWQAQTPQMFRLGLLREALSQALASGHAVTDEASAIEMLGHRPLLVQGSLRNFKVTYPEDFELADAVLQPPRKEGK